jgi:hypothetical protein
MLLRRTALCHDGFEPDPVGGSDVKCNAGAHARSSHMRNRWESNIGLFCLDQSTSGLTETQESDLGIPVQCVGTRQDRSFDVSTANASDATHS